MRLLPALFATVLAAGLALPALAQETPRPIGSFDAATGKSRLSFPPSPLVDYHHMALHLDIADMNTPRMEAVQNLSFTPVARPLSTLSLDAKLLTIKSVTAVKPAGQRVIYRHDGRKLELTFDPPLPPAQAAEIETTYTVDDPPQGITWTPESPAWPGRAAQLHSQGEAETNSYWFPCHDSPNVRLTTELFVTVPSGYIVSSNGRMPEAPKPSQSGRTTFHWLQDKSHVNYLVSLVVGKFDVENVARKGKDRVPLPVYVPPGRGGDIAPTYGNTGKMIDLFEKRTGTAYPWDQYAQVVVWNFGAGGMENTSATTMYDTAILSAEGRGDGDLEGLISHELAHQWFGDLLTCKSWEHIWLNEGFATYFTNLWWEQRDGKDAYLAAVRRQFDTVSRADRADAPYQPAMVSKDFRDPGETFGRAANPYPKGASILHMLRAKLGDEVFFRALAVYVDRFKFKLVETNDFRRVMEDVSGETLEHFFSQWCYHPGVPDLEVATEWKADTSELVLTIEQKQTIDGYNPAFAFTLPVWAETKAGSGAAALGDIEGKERKTVAKFKLAGEPSMVALDPGLCVLAKMKIDQPMRRWLAQLDRGPTLVSRVQAARALAADSSSIGASALAKLAGDSRAPDFLRQECITALGERKDTASLAEVSRAQTKSRDVRETLMDTAGAAIAANPDGPDVARLRDMIISAAGREESSRVRAAALRAIGTLKLKDRVPMLIAAAEIESQHDRIRQGALEGLATLDAPEGLSVALAHAQAGMLNRTRPIAINAAAKLAHHNPSVAVPALVRLLADRERRAWTAAGEALVQIKDPSAVAAMKEVQKSKKDAADRDLIQKWIDALSAPKK